MNDICDCHFHVFAPHDQFPLVATRSYEPPVVSITDYQSLFAPLGITRMVLVQPSCYGSDNRYMFEALATLGRFGRAVVALDPEVSDAELAAMHKAGARGVRVNAVGGSTLSIAQLVALAPKLHRVGWHVQTFMPPGQVPTIEQALLDTGLPIVLDHCGSVDSRLGLEQPTMHTLKRMLATGRVWIKLSGAFRITQASAPYQDIKPYVQALMALRPDRMVWGSDWPYISFSDQLAHDFNPLDFFYEAIQDPLQRQRLLIDNAKVLYQFD